MARKSVKSEFSLGENLITEIGSAVTDLLTQHADEIGEYIQDSDKRKTGVAFNITLDYSEPVPSVDVKMKFSASVTDKRTITCEDPNQPELFRRFTPEEVSERDEAAKEEQSESENGAGLSSVGEALTKAEQKDAAKQAKANEKAAAKAAKAEAKAAKKAGKGGKGKKSEGLAAGSEMSAGETE